MSSSRARLQREDMKRGRRERPQKARQIKAYMNIQSRKTLIQRPTKNECIHSVSYTALNCVFVYEK